MTRSWMVTGKGALRRRHFLESADVINIFPSIIVSNFKHAFENYRCLDDATPFIALILLIATNNNMFPCKLVFFIEIDTPI